MGEGLELLERMWIPAYAGPSPPASSRGASLFALGTEVATTSTRRGRAVQIGRGLLAGAELPVVAPSLEQGKTLEQEGGGHMPRELVRHLVVELIPAEVLAPVLAGEGARRLPLAGGLQEYSD